jgi:hypothetical protein
MEALSLTKSKDKAHYSIATRKKNLSETIIHERLSNGALKLEMLCVLQIVSMRELAMDELEACRRNPWECLANDEMAA